MITYPCSFSAHLQIWLLILSEMCRRFLNDVTNFKTNLDTGVVDRFGASSGAQPINTAKLDVVNQLFRKVDLKVSTVEKPFHLKEEYDGQLTITTPNNADFNMTAVDAESGDRYYINEQLTYRVPVNKVGTMEKIFISDGEFCLG